MFLKNNFLTNFVLAALEFDPTLTVDEEDPPPPPLGLRKTIISSQSNKRTLKKIFFIFKKFFSSIYVQVQVHSLFHAKKHV